MKCTYFIIKIVLIVLIMVLVIDFLLVFNPFSAGDTIKGNESQGLKKLESKPGLDLDILDEDSAGTEGSNIESDASEEIIGYTYPESEEVIKEENPNKGPDYYLTYEEIASIEKISLPDKLFGLSVLRKIDKSNLEKMLRLADGGITQEEWITLNSIMEKYLSDKDIIRLKDIIYKNKRVYEDNKLAKK